MNQFSISELSKFSGIQAHTIRAWEKRYNALRPGRSSGNTRFYNNNHLRRLLNMVSLLPFQHKISELGSLEDAELFSLVEKHCIQPCDNAEEYFISQLIAAGITYDEIHFSSIFAHCQLRFGLDEFWIRVLYPMLQRVGVMWRCDKVNAGNEHFLTTLLNRKLQSAIDSLPPPRKENSSWLLCLPEHEFHETGLTMAHYMLRGARQNSVYLGANVPLETILSTADYIQADHLLLFLVHKENETDVKRFLSELNKKFSGNHIYVACSGDLVGINHGKKVRYLSSAEELISILNNV